MKKVKIPAHMVKVGYQVFMDLMDKPWTVTEVKDRGFCIEIHYGKLFEMRNVNSLIVIGE